MDLDKALADKKKSLENKLEIAVRATLSIVSSSIINYNEKKEPLYLLEAAAYIVMISKYIREISGKYVAVREAYEILSKTGYVPDNLLKSLEICKSECDNKKVLKYQLTN